MSIKQSEHKNNFTKGFGFDIVKITCNQDTFDRLIKIRHFKFKTSIFFNI